MLLALALSACNLIQDRPQTADPFRIEFQDLANGDSVAQNVQRPVVLTATDTEGSGIARVDLFIDDALHQRGTPIENIAVPVFTVEMDWTPRSTGLHVLRAVAYRTDSTTAETTISVLVGPEGMLTETVSPS